MTGVSPRCWAPKRIIHSCYCCPYFSLLSLINLFTNALPDMATSYSHIYKNLVMPLHYKNLRLLPIWSQYLQLPKLVYCSIHLLPTSYIGRLNIFSLISLFLASHCSFSMEQLFLYFLPEISFSLLKAWFKYHFLFQAEQLLIPYNLNQVYC